MKDYLNDLATFHAQSGDEKHDPAQKMDLLTRAVANLIDEVLILRAIVQDVGGISEEKWREMYREMKMNVLFSRAGEAPPAVFKYQRFFMDARESAVALIPDEADRNAAIAALRAAK